MTQKTTERGEWIIQRCTQKWIGTELQYEDWPGYSEGLMSRAKMLEALKECNQQWPEHEFRGHNRVNQLGPRLVPESGKRSPRP